MGSMMPDMMQMSDAPQMVVRVKRPRDSDPVPELLVEPRTRAAGKRTKPSASAVALKLLDSVNCNHWDDFDEEGLPASWLHAAAEAGSWGNLAHLPSIPLGPGRGEKRATASDGKMPMFRESARQVVRGADGGTVELVDIEPAASAASLPAARPASSIFTLDGEALVAEESQQMPEETASSEGYVWDVYALSSAPPSERLAASDGLFDFSAYVRLTSSAMHGSDVGSSDEEDAGDIDDDSESNASSGGRGSDISEVSSAADAAYPRTAEVLEPDWASTMD
mmetsp:Transcript_65333/g.156178  ORF Transcript_65333/g.156178 Transcript_65333/m.156178 type:complete len:280 (-) Transcript_65333:3-842(-)